MKRIDRIRTMTTEEIAKKIIKLNITDEYCKGDCEDVWGVPEEELDLMYSFCPECGQRLDWRVEE